MKETVCQVHFDAHSLTRRRLEKASILLVRQAKECASPDRAAKLTQNSRKSKEAIDKANICPLGQWISGDDDNGSSKWMVECPVLEIM